MKLVLFVHMHHNKASTESQRNDYWQQEAIFPSLERSIFGFFFNERILWCLRSSPWRRRRGRVAVSGWWHSGRGTNQSGASSAAGPTSPLKREEPLHVRWTLQLHRGPKIWSNTSAASTKAGGGVSIPTVPAVLRGSLSYSVETGTNRPRRYFFRVGVSVPVLIGMISNCGVSESSWPPYRNSTRIGSLLSHDARSAPGHGNTTITRLPSSRRTT